MKTKVKRGKFITIEGGEGSGKSTQISILVNRLQEEGVSAVKTREPGGAPTSDAIRSLLVSGEISFWEPISETMLHFAARHEHIIKTINPSLDKGLWVISDRFSDSTMAYQGYGQGVSKSIIDSLYTITADNIEPDLTLILDLEPEVGLKRAVDRNVLLSSNEDRYERMDIEFHRKLRKGFLDIAKNNPTRCRVIKAQGSLDDVSVRVWKEVSQKFLIKDI